MISLTHNRALHYHIQRTNKTCIHVHLYTRQRLPSYDEMEIINVSHAGRSFQSAVGAPKRSARLFSTSLWSPAPAELTVTTPKRSSRRFLASALSMLLLQEMGALLAVGLSCNNSRRITQDHVLTLHHQRWLLLHLREFCQQYNLRK